MNSGFYIHTLQLGTSLERRAKRKQIKRDNKIPTHPTPAHKTPHS